MRLKNKFILITSLVFFICVLLSPMVMADSDYSLMIGENEQLIMTYEYTIVDNSSLEKLIEEENYDLDLLSIVQGDCIEWIVEVIEDVDPSGSWGYGNYWEILVDEYEYGREDYYGYDYQQSHKYKIHKDPYDFAWDLISENNDFTLIIIPKDVENYLEDVKEQLEYCSDIYYYEVDDYICYSSSSDYSVEDDYQETDIYKIDGQTLHEDYREIGLKGHTKYKYNDDGLLDTYVLYRGDEKALQMELNYYYSYDVYDEEQEFIKALFIVIAIILGVLLITPLFVHVINVKKKRGTIKRKLFSNIIKEAKDQLLCLFIIGLFGLVFVAPYLFSMLLYYAYYYVNFQVILTILIIAGIIPYFIILRYFLIRDYPNDIQEKKGKFTLKRQEKNKNPINKRVKHGKKETIQKNKYCTKCGTVLSGQALFCHNCGKPINTITRFCQYCGTYKLREATFCHKCGNSLLSQSPPEINVSRRIHTIQKQELSHATEDKGKEISCGYCGNEFKLR